MKPRLAVLVFRSLLRLYPRQFRARFGAEQVEVFVRLLDDEAPSGVFTRFGWAVRCFWQTTRGALAVRRDRRLGRSRRSEQDVRRPACDVLTARDVRRGQPASRGRRRLRRGGATDRSLAGIAVGAIGAVWLGQYLASLVLGVTPRDPATFVAVAALLVVTAVAASWVPARRAGRVDPVIALRAD